MNTTLLIAKRLTTVPTELYSGTLCVLLVGLFILYTYFVSASVMQVVLRKELAQDIGAVKSEISVLEARYIEAQHAVSDQLADASEFNETTEKIFINRTEPSLVLSTGVTR